MSTEEYTYRYPHPAVTTDCVVFGFDGVRLNVLLIERANLAAAQFRNALHLFPLPPSKWTPEVLCYSGYYELGISEVWDMIDRYFEHVNKNGYFARKRSQQEKYWMYETINEQLKARFYSDPEVQRLLNIKQDMVLNNQQSSFVAAADVLRHYYENLNKNND